MKHVKETEKMIKLEDELEKLNLKGIEIDNKENKVSNISDSLQ